MGVTLLLKYPGVQRSQREKIEADSVSLCRKLSLGPSSELFITEYPWVEYTTDGQGSQGGCGEGLWGRIKAEG